MVAYVYVDDNSYVTGWSSSPDSETVKVEDVPDSFSHNYICYRLVGRKLIYDDTNALAKEKNMLRQDILSLVNTTSMVPVVLHEELYEFKPTESNMAHLHSSINVVNSGYTGVIHIELVKNKEVGIYTCTSDDILELMKQIFANTENKRRVLKAKLDVVDSITSLETLYIYKERMGGY